jgi:hypothetical protein
MSSLLQIAEVFGNDTAIYIEENKRRTAWCPFLEQACTKQSKTKPLGICSYTDGTRATVVCPSRFRESGKILVDAGRAAFGRGRRVVALPEVKLLQLPVSLRKIGKIDYVLALLDQNGEPIDFAAVEVQAVYISGKSTRGPFEDYLRTGHTDPSSRRRPDFRSSAQKRLMPQLSLKVPVFRRWAKKFFVVVDSAFFSELPKISVVAEEHAEITWLVYPFDRVDVGFSIGEPEVYYTLWEDVLTSLREGNPPTKEELLQGFRRPNKRKISFET